MLSQQAKVILPGTAFGQLLRLDGAASFWGGVDPASGMLTDPTSTSHGVCIAGRVMMIPATRGSSSSSAVLLELLHRRVAPAALILGSVDAILGLGILVSGEMGWPTIPLLILEPSQQTKFTNGREVRIEADGRLLEIAPVPEEA